jgi:hypothetical protein
MAVRMLLCCMNLIAIHAWFFNMAEGSGCALCFVENVWDIRMLIFVFISLIPV